MTDRSLLVRLLGCIAVPLFLAGCPSGGIGDPCTPEDEYRKEFSGFSEKEVNIESRSFQCLTRVCLVNHFRGRVSCPYGQDRPICVGEQTSGCRDPETAAPVTHDKKCFQPDTSNPPPAVGAPGYESAQSAEIQEVVSPQLKERVANQTVYCSCRCAGADPDANYCSCPSGFECEELLTDVGLGSEQLAGSYCIRKGTAVREGDFISPNQCELGLAPDFETDPECGDLGGLY